MSITKVSFDNKQPSERMDSQTPQEQHPFYPPNFTNFLGADYFSGNNEGQFPYQQQGRPFSKK